MKEHSVEKRLTYLYALQQLDIQLQEIEELKGDLPSVVKELETQVAESKAKVKELNDLIKRSKVERDDADVQIIALTERIQKYKSQQLQVKSNKQYDALSKEIDASMANIAKLEKDMDSCEARIQTSKTDIETSSAKLEEYSAELGEKQKELREVTKEHEKEESKLRREREKIAAQVGKADLERYERISLAKGGTAVVAVKRGACGGCFNRIPPQKILELRQNSNLFACEHCGRILVSDEIVEMSVSLS
jgi:predicted  nucleic acid-binding Zn-ribbon protein